MEAARFGDITEGTFCHGNKCCCHKGSGENIEGEETVEVEKKPVVRLGNKTKHTCPHCPHGIVEEGCKTVFVGKKQMPMSNIGHRINETCGKGVQKTGNKTVINEEPPPKEKGGNESNGQSGNSSGK